MTTMTIKPRPLDVFNDVIHALREDLGTGDVSSELLPTGQLAHAEIFSREAMVLCGQAWSDASFKAIDSGISIEWLVEEGSKLQKGGRLCQLHGPVASLLTAERTALNFLQTLSGTATKTNAYVQAIQGTQTRLLDTRKTLPGLRLAQKYAVSCGGGYNHRLGLYDAYLIKENHIQAAGSITKALTWARTKNPTLFLEIEVQTLIELEEALKGKPDRVLLDNFNLEQLQQAVLMNKPSVCLLEASGGVSLESIRAIAETGVDFISVGDLTKSVQAIDLSLLLL